MQAVTYLSLGALGCGLIATMLGAILMWPHKIRLPF